MQEKQKRRDTNSTKSDSLKVSAREEKLGVILEDEE